MGRGRRPGQLNYRPAKTGEQRRTCVICEKKKYVSELKLIRGWTHRNGHEYSVCIDQPCVDIKDLSPRRRNKYDALMRKT